MSRGVRAGLVALLVAAACFVAFALLARLVLHGPVDGPSLMVSVASETGGTDDMSDRCTPAAGTRRWTCAVFRSSDLVGEYEVTMKGDTSCWTAVRTPARDALGGSGPASAEGCVRLWQWRLL